jgi:hypothetical protein
MFLAAVRMTAASSTPKMTPQIVQVDRLGGVPQLAVVSQGSVVRPRMAQPQQVMKIKFYQFSRFRSLILRIR